jgi:hypothetical protein
MVSAQPNSVSLLALDVTGQKSVNITGFPRDATVAELVRHAVPRLRLPLQESDGRPMAYHALLEREGRHLFATETVGDVLSNVEQDRVILESSVTAGGQS